MMKTNKKKRDTLKKIGSIWITPTVLSSSIPLHAQMSGELCGGMQGVAGVWNFVFSDALDLLGLYPDGNVVRLASDRKAKWSLESNTIRIFDFENRPGREYIGEIDSSCARATGNSIPKQDPFVADKTDIALP